MLAILFPGQGSQTPSMRAEVERHRPDLLELAADVVGEDPFARVGEGTRFDQPAIYCASLAGFERLGRPRAAFHAGHSLGEVAALVAAGSLDAHDGLRVVAQRARLMQQAADAAGGGGMLALRASRAQGEEIAARCGLVLANDNAPTQVVLSGTDGALTETEREARAAGLQAKRLRVGGAFHSPAISPVVDAFAEALASIPIERPAAPVLSCVTAAPFDDVRESLAQALVRPVRWREVVEALHAAGARRFVETGPGRVLTGLVRRTLAEAETGAPDPREPARA